MYVGILHRIPNFIELSSMLASTLNSVSSASSLFGGKDFSEKRRFWMFLMTTERD